MRGDYDSELFGKQTLTDALSKVYQRNGAAEAATNKIPKDQLLTTPENDLVEHICAKLHKEPIVLHENHMTRTYNDENIEVTKVMRPLFENHPICIRSQGCSIALSIPFTGDIRLWDLTPNPYRLVLPQGDIHAAKGECAGRLNLTFLYPLDDLDEKTLSNDIDRELESIRFFIDSQVKDVIAYNRELRKVIENSVTARKERLLKAAGVMGRLGITLERDPNAPSMTPLQLTPKIVKPLPSSPRYQFNPEPGLDSNQYKHILSVVRHITRTYETTPSTFRKLDEKELRNLILAHLNAYFKGGATGETFRKLGKTDVRIENDNRAAFVAECKMWKGAASFHASINQLLGYLTWRDCKAAIIVFNKRNSGFSGIRSKISSELPRHAQFKRDIENKEGQGEWRNVFRSSEDELREVTIHVFAVNLFVGDSPEP